MRLALALGLTIAFGGTALAQDLAVPPAMSAVPAIQPVQPTNPRLPVTVNAPAPSVSPQILSAADVALYRQAFAAARSGQSAKVKSLLVKAGDPALEGYAEAARLLATKKPKIAELVAWLKEHRDLSVADRIYRLAVANSTKTVRRHRKLIKVAVVTNIPAPLNVGRRAPGGYEDLEAPEPTPSSDAARAILAPVLADIKAGTPDAAAALLQGLQSSGAAPAQDIAILSHRIAASYRAEGLDAQAFQLASSVTDTNPCPELEWDAGFSAYRLGRWADASAHLERLAQNGAVMGTLRAQAAFWAARAHMQSGDPQKVISLLAAAAKEEPTFYGLVAERMLGMDTNTGFSDPVLGKNDFTALMAVPSAHRAVALWQVGESEFVGPELNHAFVDNNEALDPAMAALARALGVTNVELRASEKSVSHGLLLTGLFPVPPYEPQDGYHVDQSLVLAFARIESRFQNGATSPVGARGIMQLMPGTALLMGGKDAADQLYDPSYALSLGQRYIAQLLNRLDGNLMELGGAYNAGPLKVDRWLTTKAGKDDPLLFLESIPVAETRSYVRRLMEYHWMYRRRFGEDARSLDETARGTWPIYRPAMPAEPKVETAVARTPVIDASFHYVNIGADRIDQSVAFVPVHIALLTVSDTRTKDDDVSGDTLEKRLKEAGHILCARTIVPDDREKIAAQLRLWVADPRIDVVISTGGTGLTGRDVTVEAFKSVFEKEIDGFSAIFHQISFAKIGTSTVQSRACAGVAGGTYLFALPGSPGAVKDGWDGILKWQLDIRHRPCNFVEIMPRLMER